MGRKLSTGLRAHDIARGLGIEAVGADCEILHVGSIAEAGTGWLTFAKNEQWALRARADATLICTHDSYKAGSSCLLSTNPRLDFARALAYIESLSGFDWSNRPPEIHPSVKIGRHAVIASGVKIGEGSVVGHHVVIGAEVEIGKFCNIKSGAVIGEEGFGFERDGSGRAVRLPHVGGVKIGDFVEVGSLTTVCRGTLGDTVLADGCKIDDHVHIAHNVFVGNDAFVIACAEVSGGVRIGARAWIAPNASVINQVSIGDDAVIGLGAVVVKSAEAGAVVVGNPAKPLRKS